MTQKHTPGPWAADFEDGRNIGGMVLMAVKSPRGLPVALIPCRPVDTPKAHPNLEADALLIASAPELLAALVELVALVDEGAFIDLANIEATPISRKLRAAIAKASPQTR
mgnify:CR=1 FL=1